MIDREHDKQYIRGKLIDEIANAELEKRKLQEEKEEAHRKVLEILEKMGK